MVFKKSKVKSSKNAKDDSNAKQSSSETKDSQEDNVNQLLGATIAAINVTKDLVPIDLAKGILGTVANILSIAQSVIKNKSDFLVLANKCETIRKALERATKNATEDDLRGSLGDALSELNISVNRINSDVATKKEQRFWKKLCSVTIDHDQITAWDKDLDRVLVFFNFEAIAGIAIDVKKMASQLQGSAASINVPKYRPKEPPSRPSMFYGRDDLVVELTNLVVNDEHIALIGPGGMGKSSLAKAILNEKLVREKFTDRRYFVTYDGLDPSTITFDAFMTRFAGVLGIELAGADPVGQISSFLRAATALVVLDNAETFEEASGSLALSEIPTAIAEIADVPGIVLILTSRSRRNAPNVCWITKDIPPLDLSSAQDAFFRIYRQASRSTAEEGIAALLEALDFHPLSINLLANAAQQNGWSQRMLLKRWKDRDSKVLDHGKGKLQSLSYTMGLSLSSPTIQNLGEDGRRALATIAFLPQGLNEALASDLLPSVPQVDTICDVLCMQSLVYRQDDFIKMLAPIRHFVRDFSPSLDSTCLRDIRAFYYRTVRRYSGARDNYADIIISDHLNIEHVLPFGLAHIPAETYDACGQFLRCLKSHLPRSTTLAPAIFNIIENPSTWMPKANCLWQLGCIYSTLSQLAEQIKAFKAAGVLYLTAGEHENVAQCVVQCADAYRCQGHYIQSQQVLEDFQCSDSWKYLGESTKARAWYILDITRTYTFTTSADELFVRSMDDRSRGLRSKIWHWRAKLHYGGDIFQVKMHLEDLFLQCQQIGHLFDRKDVLVGLAEVAFCEGRLSDTMDLLQKLVEMLERQDPLGVLWYTVRKAVVASRQGNYGLARELIQQTSESFEVFALRCARTYIHRSYGSACIELAAGEYVRAKSHFTATIEGCDIQGNLHAKSWSTRGLGEVAFVQGSFAVAAECFAKTQSLCSEMGVPPKHLYSCSLLSALPDKFEGWVLFLEGRSPFANVI
ncbi:hypothetical protein DFH29DRAFT_149125 [Suillus ampliporus]|nr:hypothetical protein DFH29DRAFT_149125 [Suillus ampliporus]